MICFYHNDLDGRFSAGIVSCWVGIKRVEIPIQFIEMDYAKSIPWDKIKPDEQIWIVDFSFSPEDMRKLFSLTKDITWIDHHKTAIVKYADWSGHIKGIRRPDEAACVLTWKYVHWMSGRGGDIENLNAVCPSGLEVPRSVAMIGDYDAWLHKIPDSTAFYEGCKLLDSTPGNEDLWNLLTGEAEGKYGDGRPLPKRDVCSSVIQAGKTAIKYRDSYCKDMCDSYGFESEIDGVKCWVTNIYRFGSFGFAKRMEQYPVCVGCVFNGIKWTISLYSDKPDMDVSLICKNHGGGGHKGAAGFVTIDFPFKKSNITGPT